jgi:hypothetical protein
MCRKAFGMSSSRKSLQFHEICCKRQCVVGFASVMKYECDWWAGGWRGGGWEVECFHIYQQPGTCDTIGCDD